MEAEQQTPEAQSTELDLKKILEAILFNSQKPMSPRELRELLKQAAEKFDAPGTAKFRKTPEEAIEQALLVLEGEINGLSRPFRLTCVAGAWQFVSEPEYSPWLKALLGEKNRPARLSQPGLETLAIVAYRQPITRAEIEQIRGVSVDGVMQTLLERGLVENAGRAEVVGRPMTYATTTLFLDYFGLRNLEDLPAADELRRIPVKKPESLLTVDPGLATAPPDQLVAGEAGESSPGSNDVVSTAAPPPPE